VSDENALEIRRRSQAQNDFKRNSRRLGGVSGLRMILERIDKRIHFAGGILDLTCDQWGWSSPLETHFKGSTLRAARSTVNFAST